MVEDQLVRGFYENFIVMDQSRIQTTIPVSAKVPARFNLPLNTETVVVLREDTYIPGATVTLNTGGLYYQRANQYLASGGDEIADQAQSRNTVGPGS